MKKIIQATCIAYTLLMLLVVLFGKLNLLSSINFDLVWQLFVFAISVSALVYFTDYLIETSYLNIIVKVLTSFAVVLAEGVLFGMYHFGLDTIIGLTPTVILVFFSTSAIIYLLEKRDADFINKKIQNRVIAKTGGENNVRN